MYAADRGMNGNVYDVNSDKSPCLTTNKGEGIKITGATIRPASIVGRRLNDLKVLQRAGEIKDLQTQVRYNLIPAQKICGEKVRGTDYIADFVYWTKDDQFICEDAKGHKTADYIIKRKLMKLIHNIDVVEV